MSVGLVRVPLDLEPFGRRVGQPNPRCRRTHAAVRRTARRTRGSACRKNGGYGNRESFAIDLSAFGHPCGLSAPVASEEDIGPNSLASLNYTGGTSGQPKAVMLSHNEFARHRAEHASWRAPWGPADVMVNMRPLWLIVWHYCTRASDSRRRRRGALVCRFEPAHMGVFALKNTAQTATSMVPTHLVRMVRDFAPSRLRSLASLRCIDIGAASVPLETFERGA